MKLVIEMYSYLCATKKFIVNDINADYSDFGSQSDINPEDAEPYGCGNMTFTRKKLTNEVLNKYNISEEEYNEICSKLEEKLSFGSCGWCI